MTELILSDPVRSSLDDCYEGHAIPLPGASNSFLLRVMWRGISCIELNPLMCCMNINVIKIPYLLLTI